MKLQYMDAKEFLEAGYLLEVNRQFLHPLGLALEVILEADGSERLGGIWDYRHDPEGIRFGEIDDDAREKAARIAALWEERAKVRQERLGYVIQPLEDCK